MAAFENEMVKADAFQSPSPELHNRRLLAIPLHDTLMERPSRQRLF